MIVRDSSATIARCLRSVLPYVDELIIGDTGSLDDTRRIVQLEADGHGKPLRLLDLSPNARPELFCVDSSTTWENRHIPGPYSDAHMLVDFGAARQATWDAASGDFLLWLDSDDVLDGGAHLAHVLASLAREDLDAAIFPYDYSHDRHGNVTCRLLRERVVKRGTAQWTQPVHEVLVPVGRAKLFEEIKTIHQHNAHDRPCALKHRNVKILTLAREKELAEEKPDPRTLFYLGMEWRTLNADRALGFFEAYLEKSGWDEERSMAQLIAGNLHEQAQRVKKAWECYALSFSDFPHFPDPLFALARLAYFRSEWGKCVELTERGFEVATNSRKKGRQQTLMSNDLERKWRPYRFYGRSLCELGRLEEAEKAYRAGLDVMPDDHGLREGLEICQAALAARKEKPPVSDSLKLQFSESDSLESPPLEIPSGVLMSFAIQLWKLCMEAGHHTRALQLLDSLPGVVALSPHVARARALTLEKLPKTPDGLTLLAVDEDGPTQPAAPVLENAPTAKEKETSAPHVYVAGKPSVVIWTGLGLEPWSPASIDEGGIGGSETAVVHMARELRKLGHQVTVISDCQHLAGNYDSVEYLDFRTIDARPKMTPDIFVSSRQPQIFRARHKLEGKAHILWVHDIHCGKPDVGMESDLLSADRIFCLSKWHREFFIKVYNHLAPSNVAVTRNGIDLARYAKEPVKEGNKLVFSSSPNRGLDRLLLLFPRIRSQVPDAELHLFYGFENWEKAARLQGDARELGQIAYFRQMIAEAEKGGGVHWHGRVSQKELAQYQLQSKIWAYPTNFHETSCITAMECEAAGCVPVTSHLAALPETVSHGVLLKQPGSPAYDDAFVKWCVRLLRDDEEREKFAKAGRAFALEHFGWAKVAAEWSAFFPALLSKNRVSFAYGEE